MKTNLTFKELKRIAEENIDGFTDLEKPDLRLEGVEYLEDEDVWEIIVSYLVKDEDPHALSFLQFKNELEYSVIRLYKKLKIDSKKNVISVYPYDSN